VGKTASFLPSINARISYGRNGLQGKVPENENGKAQSLKYTYKSDRSITLATSETHYNQVFR
jgi:hypothetical protein